MTKNLDLLLKEIVLKQIDNVIPPPKEEVWENIRIKLRKEWKHKHIRRLNPVLAACMVLAVLTVTFASFHEPVMAFTGKILKTMEEMVGSTFVIRKVVSPELNIQENREINKSNDPRIDEARKSVSFKVLIPKYTPKYYELYNVNIFNKDKDREKVTLLYINAKDDNKKESFEITQQSFPNDSESEMKYEIDENTKVEHIIVNEIKCSFLSYEEKHNMLFWDSNNISYKIDGNISKDDMVNIVKSMK